MLHQRTVDLQSGSCRPAQSSNSEVSGNKVETDTFNLKQEPTLFQLQAVS
jgi:hypothetical protein